MSAAAREAAGLLGCGKLFHLTVPAGLKTDCHEELSAAISRGDIRLIGLGSRTGWPTIQELGSESPPLPPPGEPFLVEDFTLANAVHHRIEAASRLAANEHELAWLPFPQLARWSPGDRSALDQPLDLEKDREWVRSLPKVELHCHLGGYGTHGPELQSSARTLQSSARPLHHAPSTIRHLRSAIFLASSLSAFQHFSISAFTPTMPTACIQHPGSKVALHSERLIVTFTDDAGNDLKREIPLHDLERLIFAETVSITAPDLAETLRRAIPVSLIDAQGRFLGSFQPAAPDHGAARLRHYQRTLEPDFQLSIARKLIVAKIYNQPAKSRSATSGSRC